MNEYPAEIYPYLKRVLDKSHWDSNDPQDRVWKDFCESEDLTHYVPSALKTGVYYRVSPKGEVALRLHDELLASGSQPSQQNEPAPTSTVAVIQPSALDLLPDEAMMTYVELAKQLSLNPEALRSRLRRWQKTNSDGWQEIIESKAKQPRYLYRVGAVRHILRAAIDSK